MSKSPNRHLVRFTRKYETNWKKSTHSQVFIMFFNTPTYKLLAEFSVWFRLKSQSCKTFEIIMSTKYVLFKFRFWEGEGLSGCSPPPPIWVRQCFQVFLFHHQSLLSASQSQYRLYLRMESGSRKH